MKKFLTGILIFLIFIFCLLIYSRFIGIKGLKTNEITLYENIEDGYDGLKIIHFSDLHYKKIIDEKKVKNAIKEINKIEPDLILFTGDLFDDDYEVTNTDVNFLIKELSKLEAKYGIFSILGDSDYKQVDLVKNIYIQSEFTLLENTSTIIYNENQDKILLGGFSSSLKKDFNIDEVLETSNNNIDISYKIMMIHEPDNISKFQKNINSPMLIVGGHSINGSINIPLVRSLLLPNGAKKYSKNYYNIDNAKIYISNGIGVNDYNFRLFNTPSINFYRIYKK